MSVSNEDLRTCFEVINTDRNNVISAEEFRTFMRGNATPTVNGSQTYGACACLIKSAKWHW